ncbi:hypothetical protein [Asaccharospora irregularis]|uniref:Uncharacterized protein n=1 Tax=Asaccharospora irregularis DSM 2635 TaxID=1121321 RepID=A0A1M5QYB0_9FIRM|nr:hypothetical protein [Asaccharospora irregularis]SHH18689.1 hypothetical protein SAMN04488530_1255 [Asaccharospora irregularis DSM 2635]
MILKKKTLEDRFKKMLKKKNVQITVEDVMKYLNIDREKAKSLVEDFLIN